MATTPENRPRADLRAEPPCSGVSAGATSCARSPSARWLSSRRSTSSDDPAVEIALWNSPGPRRPWRTDRYPRRGRRHIWLAQHRPRHHPCLAGSAHGVPQRAASCPPRPGRSGPSTRRLDYPSDQASHHTSPSAAISVVTVSNSSTRHNIAAGSDSPGRTPRSWGRCRSAVLMRRTVATSWLPACSR